MQVCWKSPWSHFTSFTIELQNEIWKEELLMMPKLQAFPEGEPITV
jgi:hypothetical protein